MHTSVTNLVKIQSGCSLISLLFLETTIPDAQNPKNFPRYLSFLKRRAAIIRYMLIIAN